MSRVVTSADIDALNRVIRQQGLEIQQTNERVARLEQQVRVLNTPSPTVPAPPPVELVNGPAPAGTLPAYGPGLVENVVSRETREEYVTGLAPSDPIGGDTLMESGVAPDAIVSATGE